MGTPLISGITSEAVDNAFSDICLPAISQGFGLNSFRTCTVFVTCCWCRLELASGWRCRNLLPVHGLVDRGLFCYAIACSL